MDLSRLSNILLIRMMDDYGNILLIRMMDDYEYPDFVEIKYILMNKTQERICMMVKKRAAEIHTDYEPTK